MGQNIYSGSLDQNLEKVFSELPKVKVLAVSAGAGGPQSFV
jgi:hypothetical protein